MKVLIYCRQGFENDCAQEIVSYCEKRKDWGSAPIFQKNAGYIEVEIYADAPDVIEGLKFDELVFARQLIFVDQKQRDLPEEDRISPLVWNVDKLFDDLGAEKLYSDLVIEYPDTNEGKEFNKFAKKVFKVVENKIKKKGFKRVYSRKDLPKIHLFFCSYEEAYAGISVPGNSSPHDMGILRLKFPADAPSRSCLKLEEAFHVLLGKDRWPKLLTEGMVCVDLGACPGGWTYHMVQRGLFVHAVDNGAIDESLMKTGLVNHHTEDAFKFVPKEPVDWLVCDVADQPMRIADLVGKWFKEQWCTCAVVNFKLPMKKRFEELKKCMDRVTDLGDFDPSTDIVRAKQLYHDRSEVTVLFRQLPRKKKFYRF